METHPSQNSIIIQLNKSSVRDRSFSRKLKVSGLSFYPKSNSTEINAFWLGLVCSVLIKEYGEIPEVAALMQRCLPYL